MKYFLVYFALFLIIQDTMRYYEVKAMPMQTTVVIDFPMEQPDGTMPPTTNFVPTTPDATTSSTTSTTTTTTTTTTPSPTTARKGRGNKTRDNKGKK